MKLSVADFNSSLERLHWKEQHLRGGPHAVRICGRPDQWLSGLVSLGRTLLASGTWAESAGREQTGLRLCGVPEIGMESESQRSGMKSLRSGTGSLRSGDGVPGIRDGVRVVGWGS